MGISHMVFFMNLYNNHMNRLYILIKSQGITQKKIADTLHVDPSLVSKWLKGSRTPSTTQYQALAKMLQVPIEALLEDVDIYKKHINMDLIVLLDFKGYIHLKYNMLSMIFLMSVSILYIARIKINEITVITSILGLSLIVIEIKRLMKPPKSLISHHMQSMDVSHTFIRKDFNTTHFKMGVLYHALMFFIQPILMILMYDMNEAFFNTQSETIIIVWFLITFIYLGYALISYIIKRYPNKITYHMSTFRFQEFYGLMIKVIVIVQSVFIFMSLLLLDMTHPLELHVFTLTICAYILGHLIHQHALIFGSMYTFEFKEKMDKMSIS